MFASMNAYIHPSIICMFVKARVVLHFGLTCFLSDKGIFTSMILPFVYDVFQG